MDVEQARERRGVNRPVAAKGQHDQIARIAPAFGGDGAQRSCHRRVGDAVHSPRGLVDAKPQRLCDMRLQRGMRQLASDRKRAAGQRDRIDKAQHHIGVGHGRNDPAAIVTDGSGRGAGALGSDPKRAAGIEPGHAAAACADLGDIDRR